MGSSNEIRAERGLCYAPNKVVADHAIIMGQHMTLGHDGLPGYLRELRLERLRDAASGFSDDLNLALYRRAKERISFILRQRFSAHKLSHFAGMREHVQHKRAIPIARHRSPGACAEFRPVEWDS